jgi:carbonic anhydrase/acetyltransferase-like protein (isoleucine patch superfamily)
MTNYLDSESTHIDESAFIAKNATVLGNVTVGAHASVWFNVVIRGDVEKIAIGARSNIQDLTMIHADAGSPCTIGAGVTVGHRAIVHGATVEDGAMIGMGAIVMNGAKIGAQSIVAAGALIGEGKEIPPRSLVVGVPGKVIRSLTEPELAALQISADHYVANGRAFKAAGHAR